MGHFHIGREDSQPAEAEKYEGEMISSCDQRRAMDGQESILKVGS